MHGWMVRKGDTFITTVWVPPGTVLDFSFPMAKTEEGMPVDIRHEKDEGGQVLSRVVRLTAGWRSSPSGNVAPEHRVSSGSFFEDYALAVTWM